MAEEILHCDDVARAIEELEHAGLRLDMIQPADDPALALLSGAGRCVRLLRRDAPSEPSLPRDGWVHGRAGMLYRDLLPGRLDGRLIASQIRIPHGGPVPDRVHFHRVHFQWIGCLRGWVRVLYEDQGDALVLRPGDAVLQAPGIRHRVLECSDELEVLELGSPAAHETWIEHELALPTPQLRPQREFGGQRFVHFVAGPAREEDLGLAAATQQRADGRRWQEWLGVLPLPTAWSGRECFLHLVEGALRVGAQELREGACLVLPRGDARPVIADRRSTVLAVAFAPELLRSAP